MGLATGTRLGPYEIACAIGAGGMGEVYRARDTKLGRDVAIKVLPEAFAHDADRLSRFQREARTLAALNHANIATIYGLEQSGDTSYLVMELVPGETLAERVKRDGAIATEEALGLAKQMAHALEAAHEKGIIHRDLKPANVKLTPEGNVKVLDFGLAKAFAGDAANDDPSNSPTLSMAATMHGVILGTAAYMSPEQARGKEADKRTDIWAFGCVLYELLTGKQVFRGETRQDTIVVTLGQEPDWEALPTCTPVKIRNLLRRCLQKDPQRRLRDIGDVRIEIEEASVAFGPREKRGRGKVLLWSAALLLTAITGITIWNQKFPFAIPFKEGLRPIQSLAVLPLQDLSGSADQEYFADGMTDELITDLAQIRALRVISRTSVMGYKGARKPLPEIARELNVDAVVEGTVLRSGDQVRITAQLIQAPADKHLWAESYEGNLRDTLALQKEVARNIAEEIRIEVTPREQAALKSVKAIDPEAYEAYLKGRYFWNKRTADGLRKAVDYFNQAITKDRNYAAAYSGLADTYALLGDWQYAVMTPKEAMPRAKAAAMKALELDDSLGEAHASLAFCLDGFDWNFEAADREFRRAIELSPGYATGHHWYSWHLSLLGRNSEDIAEMTKAENLAPLSLIINADLAELLLIAHFPDESTEQSRKTIEMDPEFAFAHNQLAQAY